MAITQPQPASASSKTPLCIMTFNLQQEDSAEGASNFNGQLELIRRADPDILGYPCVALGVAAPLRR